ncbi:hypothetical protein GCM10007907_18220 [Chitinimonas prasina]|uniref:DUF416 family protein n=1 Tax=Chitinimonas prasina TaxID=1434937 RepID=A0ABQ5YH92_9NEIS|nr:DUF416 family protein [Chitinimonas prasina]GLR13032.1 hypothetical protein GCM10007907_18220 [Chitinimonas prasina]
MLIFNLDELHAELEKLPHRLRAVFLAWVCERMLPSYTSFSKRYGLDQVILRDALDRAWEWLGAPSDDIDFSILAKRCEDLAPETEDYNDPLVSAALDAAVAIGALLRYLKRFENGNLSDGLTLIRDSIDMHVQELEGMDSLDSDLEGRIASHPLMQKELNVEKEDISYLKRIRGEEVNILEIKGRWYDLKIGCLGDLKA